MKMIQRALERGQVMGMVEEEKINFACAGNNNLDLFMELDIAARLEKDLTSHDSFITYFINTINFRRRPWKSGR